MRAASWAMTSKLRTPRSAARAFLHGDPAPLGGPLRLAVFGRPSDDAVMADNY